MRGPRKLPEKAATPTTTVSALAIYSIFKRAERPLTIIAALLAAAALSFISYVFAVVLLTSG